MRKVDRILNEMEEERRRDVRRAKIDFMDYRAINGLLSDLRFFEYKKDIEFPWPWIDPSIDYEYSFFDLLESSDDPIPMLMYVIESPLYTEDAENEAA